MSATNQACLRRRFITPPTERGRCSPAASIAGLGGPTDASRNGRRYSCGRWQLFRGRISRSEWGNKTLRPRRRPLPMTVPMATLLNVYSASWSVAFSATRRVVPHASTTSENDRRATVVDATTTVVTIDYQHTHTHTHSHAHDMRVMGDTEGADLYTLRSGRATALTTVSRRRSGRRPAD